MKWQLVELSECESTFNEARKHPAWTIVTAERQTKGRGRFNRAWFGEKGGLWATYNLPLAPDTPHHWGLLPLVAGVAIMNALEPFRIPHLRLRWPNDVLVGKAKLAGILVERPKADMASIGVGINVCNNIVSLHGRVQDAPARLADLVQPCPPVKKVCQLLGDALAEAFYDFLEGGETALQPALQSAWGESLPVVAITDTDRICGRFIGVEQDGSPILRRADGVDVTVPGITVIRLKELI